MATPPRTPSPNVNRLSKSPSPFHPPDLPPLSAHVASEAAAMGSPTAAPPPTPPPKDRSSPGTPTSQPTQQHNRPGTPDFFFQNSTYSMPGAYPDTRTYSPSPLAADPRTQSPETDIPYPAERVTPSPGKRRSSGSSIRNLLSSLRRPSSQSPRNPRVSDDSFGGSSTLRPDTAGRDSMASSTRPSLRKKMSSTFWSKRKSSLSVEAGLAVGDYEREGRVNHGSGPEVLQNGHSASPEQVKPFERDDASESSSIVSSLRKRSSTFWTKRKSSLGNELSQVAATNDSQPDYPGHARITSTASGPSPLDQSEAQPLHKKKSGTFWPRKLSLSLQRETENTQKRDDQGSIHAAEGIHKSSVDESEHQRKYSQAESYVPVARPPSPPPVLPELNLSDHGTGEGGLLGDGDDLFSNIGKD